MANNTFKVFDENKNNIMDDATYAANTQRESGVAAGIAQSILHNKLFYQTSMMAAAIGEYIKNQGYDATDADFPTLVNNLSLAITSVTSGIAPGVYYGTCSTASGTAAKTATISGFTSAKLVTGVCVFVLFSNANTAASPTLNISGTGAKGIVDSFNNAAVAGSLGAGRIGGFVYNGTNWVLANTGAGVQDVIRYFSCSTAAATAAKISTGNSNFSRVTGALVVVNFTNGNTAASPTLNLNATGAAAIVSGSSGTAISAAAIPTGYYALLQYNGTSWVLLNSASEQTQPTLYGTCTTAAGTAAKVVSDISGFTLRSGALVSIRFTNTNTIASPTLNINGTGNIAIYDAFTETALTAIDHKIIASMTALLAYDGTRWKLLNPSGNSVEAFGTCSTAVSTVAKTATIANFALNTGARISIKFTNGNSAASPTLNVNGTGAKAIYRGQTYETILPHEIQAGSVHDFVYDGTYWVMLSPGIKYVAIASCTTAAATAAKAVTADGLPLLSSGLMLIVTFTNKNTAANPTLNVNSTGAKDIVDVESSSVGAAAMPRTAVLAYNGKWLLVNPELPIASTTQPGIVQLSDAIDSTSTSLAATANAVGKVNNKLAAYLNCTTAAATAAKTAALTDFTLFSGAIVAIKFTNANTAANPTLNINSTGAKPIVDGTTGGVISGSFGILAGGTYVFVYDGTNWVMVNSGPFFSTTDLTAGSSSLVTGRLYYVYE
jgi:hypothetical protein